MFNRLNLKIFVIILFIIIVFMCVLRFGILPNSDSKMNAVLAPATFTISSSTHGLHNRLFVADLHTDALLWGRDLSQRYARGHVDLPRLQQGGVDLQVFSVVTKAAKSAGNLANSGDNDSLPLLFLAAWRSPLSWFSAKGRALVQAEELQTLVDDKLLTLVLRREDLKADGLKGLLALEGMHALEGEEQALKQLYDVGYRMMGLTHSFDNAIAGSASGIEKYGLTELGRKLIPQMETLGISIDLAHASDQAISETLAIATKPIVVSHGGVEGTCAGSRNLSDEQLRGVANNGGVVGVGYWQSAVCDASIEGIVAAILYTIKIAGIDHVGLGSDFDGTVATPIDTTGVALITQALLDKGLSEVEVSKVLGANIQRVLIENLPI